MKKTIAIAFVGAAALLLAGCGSSGGDDDAAPTVTTDVPASATQDPAGLLTFVNQQIGASSETAEPIVVGDAVLPVDDSTETSL